MSETTGRRERKKAQTRQALADAALRLFTERGFDNVGVRDVAEAADVAVTTLFKHFPSKEALLFDEDEGQEAALVAALRDRAPGRSVLDALRDHLARTRLAARRGTPEFEAFEELVNSTPALQEYAHRMWLRHESALAAAIAETTGAPEGDIRVAALARFVMESPSLVSGREDPRRALDEIFDLLERGWGEDPA
ncbi:TetR/AcrR family transcriptional regulator [Streptomyces sp. NBC_01565]|uniref:TetR/AcrR family transcriptional regulator n=1 Tax=unclassified Streptomyces TaxID=2593676 RepID=UPI00225C33C6|nr:TetR/AcrR family transcriptional regulator [Streptomyces sp. NBC_01565]MCX4539474.1 TetR/AcrR family transcriptional regulator [Streptomyces sp. NBC_01565]